MRAIKKCSNCNDYGVSYNYMTQYATDKKQFCSCPFGQLRKKEFMNKRAMLDVDSLYRNSKIMTVGEFRARKKSLRLVEKKLKKMAGL